MRGKGVAGKLLENLTDRLSVEGVKYMGATVNPSNAASRNLFSGFARRRNAKLHITPEYFPESAFPTLKSEDSLHECEDYFVIGPFGDSNE